MMWKLSNFNNNIAIINEEGQSILYSDLLKFSENLKTKGLNRCLVFNLCTNRIGSLMGYVTFLNNKIVPLMLDANLNIDLLYNLIKIYKPEYIWVPSEKLELFDNYTEVYSEYNYSLLKTNFVNEFNLHDDLALLLTTSGSTGSFKLVRQSYNNIKANMNSIVQYLNLNENERAITTLPMNYTYGLSIINSHLAVGASIILTEKTLMQKEFWNQLKEFKATSFGGVPYTYEMLEKLRFFRMNLPHLKTMTQAGGKLPAVLHKKFAEYSVANDKKFIVMYGQTEATARMSYLPSEKSIEKAGSIGIAIPGGKFSIVNSDGSEIREHDIAGELIYQGENVTMGYAECAEDLSKGNEREGILATGDIAKFDKDGFYYIVGRKKRFLKIFGSRVNLDEVEQLIRNNFNGIDCACTGLDDCMYIFITDESKKDDILHFVANKMGIYRAAFKAKFLEKIPRNESGKVLYPSLEGYYDKI